MAIVTLDDECMHGRPACATCREVARRDPASRMADRAAYVILAVIAIWLYFFIAVPVFRRF